MLFSYSVCEQKCLNYFKINAGSTKNKLRTEVYRIRRENGKRRFTGSMKRVELRFTGLMHRERR